MRKITSILFAIMVMVSATSYAMVKEAQATIGGVAQYMTSREVVNTQGNPTLRTNLARNRYALEFKSGMYVEFTGDSVSYIEAKTRNILTEDGLHVGSTLGNVEDQLGRADMEEGNFHIYQASGKKDIAFVYDKNNKVQLIYSGLSYEDEEHLKQAGNKNNDKNKVRKDVGRDIELASYRLRNIYWNLRSVFDRKHNRNWGWGFPGWPGRPW